MAVDAFKINETNFRKLLAHCKRLAQNRKSGELWRFEKYVEALEQFLARIEISNGSIIDKDTVITYREELRFFKGLVDAEKKETTDDQLKAVRAIQLPRCSLPDRDPSNGATQDAQSAADESRTRDLISNGLQTVYVPSLRHRSPTSDGQTGQVPSLKQMKTHATARYTSNMREELLGPEESRLRSTSGEGSQTVTGSTGGDIDDVIRHHHDAQERLADEFLAMTRSLKENATIAGNVVRDDSRALERVNLQTDANFDTLKAESARLVKHAYGSSDCWIWFMLFYVCVTFIGMVLFMRIFTKG
jgi:SNARE protein 1